MSSPPSLWVKDFVRELVAERVAEEAAVEVHASEAAEVSVASDTTATALVTDDHDHDGVDDEASPNDDAIDGATGMDVGVTVSIRGRFMSAYDIETTLTQATTATATTVAGDVNVDVDGNNNNSKKGNTGTNKITDTDTTTNNSNILSIYDVNFTTNITQQFIQFIRMKTHWESISIVDCYCDGMSTMNHNHNRMNHNHTHNNSVPSTSSSPLLIDDVLMACTTHPNIKALSFVNNSTTNQHSTSSRFNIAVIDANNENEHDRNSRSSSSSTSTPLCGYGLTYGLKYNTSLTKLKIAIVIDVETANLLARAILRNTTLLELILDGSKFLASSDSKVQGEDDDESKNDEDNKVSVQTLSFGLRFNRTIERVSLNSCHLEDNDMSILLNAMNTNASVLRHLSLRHNACYDKGMTAIAVLLQENIIEHIDMSYLIRRKQKRRTQKQQQSRKDDDEKKNATTSATNQQQKEEEQANTDNMNDDDDEKKKPKAESTDTTKTTTNKNNAEQEGDEEDKEAAQQVRNTSLQCLLMMGNSLDDDYLYSLLGIFAPTTTTKGNGKQQKQKQYSNLQELNLFGNKLSNQAITKLLAVLSQFPFLERLCIGYQQLPLSPLAQMPVPTTALQSLLQSLPSYSSSSSSLIFNPSLLTHDFITAIVTQPNNYRLCEIDIVPMVQLGGIRGLGGVGGTTTSTSTSTSTSINNNDYNTEYRLLRQLLTYHTKLNYGGRRILASYVTTPTKSSTTTTTGTAAGTTAVPVPGVVVPRGIWPLIVERANRLYPLRVVQPIDNDNDNDNSGGSSTDSVDGNSNDNGNGNDSVDGNSTATITATNITATATATMAESNSDDNDIDDDRFHAGDVIFCLLRHSPMMML